MSKENYYTVSFTIDCMGYARVKAKNKTEAGQKAIEQFCPNGRNYELADPMDVCDINKVTKEEYEARGDWD